MGVLRLVLIALAAALALPSAAAAATGPCVPGTDGPRCFVWTGKVTFVADGDTLDVDVRGDGRGSRRTRITGIQAMEMTRYSKYRSRRRGACHAVAATNRLDRLIRAARGRVRLASHGADARTGTRIRRALYARIGGAWVDVGAKLVGEGHALWLPNPDEWAWNGRYGRLAQQAAAARRRLYDPDSCRPGPAQSAPLRLTVNWDADGDDTRNLNGEWFTVANDSGADVSLGGWWVRDSHLRRFTFPAGTVVRAGDRVRVHVGRGTADGDSFFWGLAAPAFENATHDERAMGDGGYLFDPHGDLRAWDIWP